MERHFDEELAALKHTLVKMAGVAERMIGDAIHMLVDRDAAVFAAINEHERDVNQMQCAVDEMCIRLIALHQPAASNLRFILGCIKTNADIERLADQAVNVAQRAEHLIHEPPVTQFVIIPEMAAVATGMVRDSIHAYVNRNVDEARAVIARDRQLNEMKDETMVKMAEIMTKDPSTAHRCLDVAFVAHNIERMGDHAKNIAENAIFIAEGRDIRHHHEQF